jgi:hypothetical protein
LKDFGSSETIYLAGIIKVNIGIRDLPKWPFLLQLDFGLFSTQVYFLGNAFQEQ